MPQPGFFELYPAARPALPAGTYRLEADQIVTALPPDGDEVDVDVPGNDIHMKVVAPRFTLPPDQLLSTFPPADAVGDWRQRLPQVVFRRRTLPWERNHADRDADSSPPWLALVVLAEGEGALSRETSVDECVSDDVVLDGDNDTETGKFLQVTQTVVDAVFPTEADLSRLAHVRKVDLRDTELALGDDDGYMAVLMANRLPQPAPATAAGEDPKPRKYTAYLINVEGQLEFLPDDDVTNVVPEFPIYLSALVAPVLLAMVDDGQPDDVVMKPDSVTLRADADIDIDFDGGPELADGRSTTTARSTYSRAYGRQTSRTVDPGWASGPNRSAVEGSGTETAARTWLTGVPLTENAQLADLYGWHLQEKTYRFPVLLSWDFVCTGTGTFETLMNDLDTAMLGTVEDGPDQPDVAATGHISLDHTTRRGDDAEVWYRGPLVPMPTDRRTPRPGDGPVMAHSADEIRSVVPDGREDVGRAAGFEIGRLLALSKPGIVAAMMAWREDLFGAARASELADRFGPLDGLSDAVQSGGRTLEGLLAAELMIPFADGPVHLVAPRVPETAQSRFPEELKDLEPDEVLIGLGVDPAAVDEAVGQDGLAGWGTVSVARAPEARAPLSEDAAALKHLQQVVGEQVTGRAADALKIPRFDADPAVDGFDLDATIDPAGGSLDGDDLDDLDVILNRNRGDRG